MTPELPAPIAAYFTAGNAKDIDRMIAPFADDAVVTDERQAHRGRPAIRAWMEAVTAKYGATAEVLTAEATATGHRVTARVHGNFPGSPATLRYGFTLSGSEITGLEIG
ncbi:nuclear transport factor 2 family protein [Azospirillum sp. ST 5-10]|uniref:nuclear transport factor 2 family protein n=1 Tax=unclassified Azospirillum TaxID=2630922 RepID=UPI003F4A822A